MDRIEAREVLVAELARYRERSYADLQRLLETRDFHQRTGPSGARYQLQIEAVWDDHQGGDLRVWALIDDGLLQNFMFPLTEDFIIAPDGTFVGE